MQLHLEQVCEPGSGPGLRRCSCVCWNFQRRIEALGVSRVEAAQLHERQYSFGGRWEACLVWSGCCMVSTDTETDFCCVTAHPQAEGVLRIRLHKAFSFPKKNRQRNSVCHISKFIGERVFTIYICTCVCIISIFKIEFQWFGKKYHWA